MEQDYASHNSTGRPAGFGKADVFANPVQENLTSSIPTGVVDDDFSGYTGFMTHFFTDVYAGTIPSAQHIPVLRLLRLLNVRKSSTYTYGATDTLITVTINGVDYTQAYASSASATVAAWLAAHKTTIEARAGINGVIVTNPSGAQIKVVSRYKGQTFSFTAVAEQWWFFCSFCTVAAVKAGALASGEADETLEAMIDAALPEMFEFPLVFMVTRSLWRNFMHTVKNKTGDLP